MLTTKQQETLKHLDQELARRQEEDVKNKPRREHAAKETGIPISMIDSDVIRWGTWLGLIKKQSVRLGQEKDASVNLLQWFTSKKSTQAPLGFKLAKKYYSEEDRLLIQKKQVHEQCLYLSHLSQRLLDGYAKKLSTLIDFNLAHYSWDHFVVVCKEIIDCIYEELLTSMEDKELWSIYKCCKPVILMGCGILYYQNMLHQHGVAFKEKGELDSLDLKLLLFFTKGSSVQFIHHDHMEHMMHEVVLRSLTKSPQLCVFDFDVILQHCCIPSFMWLSIDFILEYGILGPFFNNNIGYHNIDGKLWSFYILGKMDDNNRLWYLDDELFMFTRQLSIALGKYMMHWFKSFYHQDLGHQQFVPFFWDRHKEYSMMLKNILFINDYARLGSFLQHLVRQKSTLVPTELDYFNYQQPFQVNASIPPWFNFSKLFDSSSKSEHVQEGWLDLQQILRW